MKVLLTICTTLIWFIAAAQLPDKVIYDLKTGKRKDDTSFVYTLPYGIKKSFLLIQAANSNMSHKKELSYDFKMKEGTKICAARGGVVTEARSDSEIGGLKTAHIHDGNFIIIMHSDSSKAYYWHLQKDGVLPAIGDTVTQGQHIGYSGNTGYSAFPHLHFQVKNKKGNEILVRFTTKKGILYLRPANLYKRPL